MLAPMGDVTTELDLGAQSRAAQIVAQAVPGLQDALKTGAEAIGAEVDGFTGSAAGAFYTALKAWYVVGSQIPQGVGRYALNLATTDANIGANQTSTVQSYSNARTRLSGVPQ